MMRFGRIGATLVLVLALLLACAPGAPTPAPVAKEKTVKVGLSLSVTGPIASTTAPVSYGVYDYLRYVNDALGGVGYTTPEGKKDRVKLELKWEDTAYDPARALATYKRLKEWGSQIMHITAGSMVLTVLAHITRDHMPVVYWNVAQPNAMAERPLYSIAGSLTYTDEYAFLMDWVKRNWKEARPPRIGIIQIETAMARAELPGKVPEYAKRAGVEYVGMEWLPYAVTESTVELRRLAEKGADWIAIGHAVGGILVILKDAVRLGLKDKIKFYLMNYSFFEDVPRLGGEVAEGVYGGVLSALPTEDLPGVKEALKIASKYRPGYEVPRVYFEGIVLGKVMVEGIRRALEEVGYENLTREAIMKGLLSIRDFDTGGLVPPITVDPEYPVLNPKFRIGVIEGGKIKLISDWLEGHYLLKGWKP